MGTILQTLLDVGRMRLDTGVPRNVAQVVTDSPRIEQLFA